MNKTVFRIDKSLILLTHATARKFLSQLDMNNRHPSDLKVVLNKSRSNHA